MSNNAFGKIFTITTFGESHGNAVGVIIDGCPSNIKISIEDIQYQVNRRRPGLNKFTTPRCEQDKIHILSGIFENKTLGTPITLVAYNQNTRSEDYDNIKEIYRPSHADFTWHKKYTHVDHRGGGRSSARETLARVAASAVADKINNQYDIQISAFVSSIGEYKINPDNIDLSIIDNNDFYTADKNIIPTWENALTQAINEGDSLGGEVKIIIKNVPIGLGEPVFEKLNANLAKALFTIPAVKGVCFGDAFELSKSKGSISNDELTIENDNIKFKTNNNAGIIGGISNGEDIIINVAIKPTSSISKIQYSVDKNSNPVELSIKGRHDPCIAIRASVVCRAMCSLVLADHLLINKIYS